MACVVLASACTPVGEVKTALTRFSVQSKSRFYKIVFWEDSPGTTASGVEAKMPVRLVQG